MARWLAIAITLLGHMLDADLPAPVLPQMMANAGYQTCRFWQVCTGISGYRMMPEIEPEHSTRGFQTPSIDQSYATALRMAIMRSRLFFSLDEEREWVQELEAESPWH